MEMTRMTAKNTVRLLPFVIGTAVYVLGGGPV